MFMWVWILDSAQTFVGLLSTAPVQVMLLSYSWSQLSSWCILVCNFISGCCWPWRHEWYRGVWTLFEIDLVCSAISGVVWYVWCVSNQFGRFWSWGRSPWGQDEVRQGSVRSGWGQAEVRLRSGRGPWGQDEVRLRSGRGPWGQAEVDWVVD